MEHMDTDISLPQHEARSQQRAQVIASKIDKLASIQQEQKMAMENVSDKVNINVGDGGGGGGGAGLAAVIAALGNRNQGGDNAALIAALGNRNDGGMATLAPLLAGLNNRNDNDGMNNIWPILLLTLLRGRGGLGGDDCGAVATAAGLSPAQAAMLQTLMEGQSDLRAQVPTTALETQNAIQSSIASLALGTQQGFANTKDAVQASLLANLTATSGVKDSVMNNAAALSRDIADVKATVQTEACATRELVQATSTAVLQKIDQNTIDDLRHRAERAERNIEVNALRSQVEVNQTVTTTQAQQQGQFQVQSQLQDLAASLRNLAGSVNIGNQAMFARQGQDVINFGGTMTGSGTQSAANTQVR